MSNIHTLSEFDEVHPNSFGMSHMNRSTSQIGEVPYTTDRVGGGLLPAMETKSNQPKRANSNLGTLKNLQNIGSKLTKAISSGKDIEIDIQLKALARQKQRIDMPMNGDVRIAAYKQREPIKPESKMTCPSGHKITATAAKKQLTALDVYTCKEELSPGVTCEAMCGGEDAHPLHLEVKFLNPADKNRYVDSVRWLSKGETETQTKAYVQGHPLVFPHLAEGVLFHDETDAWKGWMLGWNIAYWFTDIQSYFERVRRDLEEQHGNLDEDEVDEDGNGKKKEMGRGKRRKRQIAVEKKYQSDDEGEPQEEEEQWESLPPELQNEVDAEANKRAEKKPKIDHMPAAASSSYHGDLAQPDSTIVID